MERSRCCASKSSGNAANGRNFLRVMARSSLWSLFCPLPNTVEMLRGAYENLSAGDRRRAQRVIAEVVFRQHLKFRSGLEHGGQPILVGHVDLAIRQHGRRAVDRRSDAFASPDLLASLGVQAPD